MTTIAREARDAVRMTQEEFARTFGVALSTLRKHEQGVNTSNLEFYYRMISKYPRLMRRVAERLNRT